MAEGTVIEPPYVTTLEQPLVNRFPGSSVTHEQIRRERYRVLHYWEGFEEMDHPERQPLVRDLADSILSKSDLMKVGMILTLGPSDVTGPEEEPGQ